MTYRHHKFEVSQQNHGSLMLQRRKGNLNEWKNNHKSPHLPPTTTTTLSQVALFLNLTLLRRTNMRCHPPIMCPQCKPLQGQGIALPLAQKRLLWIPTHHHKPHKHVLQVHPHGSLPQSLQLPHPS